MKQRIVKKDVKNGCGYQRYSCSSKTPDTIVVSQEFEGGRLRKANT